MSQSRGRRAPSAAREPGRAAPPGAAPHQDHRSKSRNRNKIPTSIRYDLENALLGLCDVWFEEIKPHLVRNNIKLHVDGLQEDSGAEGAGAGDHRRGCAHVDPGAAPDVRALLAPQTRRRPPPVDCAGCWLTPRAASRAPSHKPPVPPARPPSSPQRIRNLIQAGCGTQSQQSASPPAPSPPASPSHLAPVLKKADGSTKQNRKSRKRQARAQLALRVPRPCRADSAPRPCRADSAPRPYRADSAPRPCRADSTTPGERCRPRLLPPTRHSVNKELIPPRPKSGTFQNKATQTMLTWKHLRPQLTIDLASLAATNSPKTSMTYPIKHEKKKKKEEDSSFFYPYDLVDLIGEQHDKRLRVIFKNPNGEESCQSIMNLASCRKRRKRDAVRRMPWK